MLLSIITVCFNCRNMILSTIKSLLEQDFINYEYIVVDGGSSDGTKDIFEKYERENDNCIFVSEPDKGIYDAMNKGVTMAHGEYIYFLNAGDTLYSNDALRKVSEYLLYGYDLVYGNIIMDNKCIRYPNKLHKDFFILREKMICHQAIFCKKDLLRENQFDIEYKICADRDWIIRLLNQGISYKYMKDVTVVNYDTSGVSSHLEAFQEDSLRIAENYGGKFAVNFVLIKRKIGRLMHVMGR